MDSFYIDIGMRIWQLRDKFGFSRETLSEMTNISPKFLYEIENGKKGMSAHTLYNLAKVLNVSSDYLLTGKEYTNSNQNPQLAEIGKIIDSFDSSKLPVIEKILNNLSDLIH